MLNPKQHIKAFILVKAYPQSSQKYQETVCCAAISEDGRRLLRLYPIRYRHLKPEQKFNRFDLVEMEISKAEKDHRPESYRVIEESINILNKGSQFSAESKAALWLGLVEDGLASLKKSQQTTSKSLGIIKPDANSLKLIIKPIKQASEEETSFLDNAYSQNNLFEENITPLNPPEYVFLYQFLIDGKTHTMQIHDWEIQATYFNYRQRYKDTALDKMKQFYEEDIRTKSPHFIMGNVGQRPYQFMIIGVLRSSANTSQHTLNFKS